MRNIKLDVPLYKQEADWECGITALKMILSYFEIDISYGDIRKNLKNYPNYGTNYADEAILASKYGLVVENWTFDHLFLMGECKRKIELKYLNKLEKSVKSADIRGKKGRLFEIKKAQKLLKNGGSLILAPLTSIDVDSSLKEGNPITVTCFTGIIYKSFELHFFHALVVYGMTESKYLVRDPSRRHKLEEISKDELIYANHRANGYVQFYKGLQK